MPISEEPPKSVNNGIKFRSLVYLRKLIILLAFKANISPYIASYRFNFNTFYPFVKLRETLSANAVQYSIILRKKLVLNHVLAVKI